MRSRALIAAAAIIAAVGILRAVFLVGHEPLVGLANNYDMIRVQACIDAYPVRDASVPLGAQSWQAPIERYAFHSSLEAPCFLTSEAWLAVLYRPLLAFLAQHSMEKDFALRAVGYIKLAFLTGMASVALVLVLRIPRNETRALALSLFFALVLFDPGVTLYLNGFYAEYAAVLFGTSAVLLIWICAQIGRPSKALLACTAICVFCAVMSKFQHVALGLLMLCALTIATKWPGRDVKPLWLIVAAAALLGLAVQSVHLNGAAAEGISIANKTNTFLGAVLGSSSNPETTASRLGLPRACADHAGKDFFFPGLAANHPCPEVATVSRARLAWLMLHEPQTLAKAFARAIDAARPWIPPHLGKVAGQEAARLPDSLWTVDAVLQRMPSWLWWTMLLSPPFMVVLGRRWLRERESAFLAIFLSAYPVLCLSIVVFGDGFADVSKQFHTGMLALLAFWLLLLLRFALGRVSAASSRFKLE